MNCPICNSEMELGYIPTSAIEWVPKYEKPHLIYKSDKSNGFRIGKHSLGDTKKQPAWYCSSCDKIIINCKEDEKEK